MDDIGSSVTTGSGLVVPQHLPFEESPRMQCIHTPANHAAPQAIFMLTDQISSLATVAVAGMHGRSPSVCGAALGGCPSADLCDLSFYQIDPGQTCRITCSGWRAHVGTRRQ